MSPLQRKPGDIWSIFKSNTRVGQKAPVPGASLLGQHSSNHYQVITPVSISQLSVSPTEENEAELLITVDLTEEETKRETSPPDEESLNKIKDL